MKTILLILEAICNILLALGIIYLIILALQYFSI